MCSCLKIGRLLLWMLGYECVSFNFVTLTLLLMFIYLICFFKSVHWYLVYSNNLYSWSICLDFVSIFAHHQIARKAWCTLMKSSNDALGVLSFKKMSVKSKQTHHLDKLLDQAEFIAWNEYKIQRRNVVKATAKEMARQTIIQILIATIP